MWLQTYTNIRFNVHTHVFSSMTNAFDGFFPFNENLIFLKKSMLCIPHIHRLTSQLDASHQLNSFLNTLSWQISQNKCWSKARWINFVIIWIMQCPSSSLSIFSHSAVQLHAIIVKRLHHITLPSKHSLWEWLLVWWNMKSEKQYKFIINWLD